MKYFLLFILFTATLHASAQSDFDSSLAKKLQADPYGMKRYYLVILTTGTANITGKSKLDSIFNGHMKNILSLASQNKLVIAGPIGKNDRSYRGIFVLNTDKLEEAQKMVQLDPAVQAKVLAAEYYPWYTSAALQQIMDIHKTISKEKM